MKKFLVLGMAAVMMFSMTGCSLVESIIENALDEEVEERLEDRLDEIEDEVEREVEKRLIEEKAKQKNSGSSSSSSSGSSSYKADPPPPRDPATSSPKASLSEKEMIEIARKAMGVSSKAKATATLESGYNYRINFEEEINSGGEIIISESSCLVDCMTGEVSGMAG